MALMILGGSDECLATLFLTPILDCWGNMCHELILKQLLSRKQPGAVRQNMLNNRKTLGFFNLCLELRKKSFQHSCQIDAVSHLIRPSFWSPRGVHLQI